MDDKLDSLLCEKYPKIFADRFKPMNETAMCWGFECDDGWYNILDIACSEIQSYIDWKNKFAKTKEEKISQVVADQVKEKFGALRFYTHGGNDYIRGIISMAEAMSARTCETCGNPGKLRGRSWLYTACDEHTKPEDLKDNNERTD